MLQKNKLYTILLVSLAILGGLLFALTNVDLGRFTIIVQFLESIAIVSFWAILYLLIKFTVFQRYQDKHQQNMPSIFVSMVRFFFIVFVILSIMVIVFDQSLMSVATLGGLVAAGVTFAVGELIMDTFSGVILEIEGPLEVNDWIKLDADREGMVISINWRTVILITVDETMIVVPHRDLTKGFTNFSRPGGAYWEFIDIGMDHSLPVERAERIIRAGVMKATAIYDHQCYASATKISESGINYELGYMVPNRSLSRRVRHDVIQAVTNHLHACGMRVSESLGEYAVSKGGKPFQEDNPIDLRGIVERVDFLKNLSEVATVKISEGALCHSYNEGESIVLEGEEGHSLFLIAEGVASVSISYVSESGEQKEKHLFNLGYGDCFGEMSLFLNDPRSANVRAATNCLVYEVSHDLIKDSLTENPEIFTKMVKDAKAKKERNLAMREKMSQMKEHEHEQHKGVLAHLKDLFR